MTGQERLRQAGGLEGEAGCSFGWHKARLWLKGNGERGLEWAGAGMA